MLESSRLAAVLTDISSRAGETVTIEGLVLEWSRFVADVESEYRLGAFDYVESLFVRDYLQEIVSRVEPELASAIHARIAPLDDRFRLATTKIDRPVVSPANRSDFWWFRIPRKLSDQLSADLRAEGTIE